MVKTYMSNKNIVTKNECMKLFYLNAAARVHIIYRMKPKANSHLNLKDFCPNVRIDFQWFKNKHKHPLLGRCCVFIS
ncbi:hypothetical protein CISIN_1g042930mg [Citrus sinensis]|uniref:Uncharacterized protein n=1 Tax=Citrus sinensis TaxID=2711 RepID=A0A067G126_CITSI|nr:hypothetical protein CISIN_1g042930mg [Citrus sinensis]